MLSMWLLGWFLISIAAGSLWVAWCAGRAEMHERGEP